MNFARSLVAKKSLAVLDWGERQVLAAVVRPGSSGWTVRGVGQAPSRGVEAGCVRHVGDAVETLVEALHAAERESGGSVDAVYYAYDDEAIESVFSRGSLSLKGEGEIRPADVRELRQVAERLISSFDKRVVYSREIHFLIDDRDTVLDPIGVFGGKLDVRLHALLTRSERHDAWRRVMERAHVRRSVPVVSAWASAAAVLTPEESSKRLLVLDWRGSLVNAFVAFNGAIAEYRAFRPAAPADPRRLAERIAAETSAWREQELAGCVLTGPAPQASQWRDRLVDALGIPVEERTASLQPLTGPSQVTLAGLVSVAAELEASFPALRPDKGLLVSVKRRAASFLNEYF